MKRTATDEHWNYYKQVQDEASDKRQVKEAYKAAKRLFYAEYYERQYDARFRGSNNVHEAIRIFENLYAEFVKKYQKDPMNFTKREMQLTTYEQMLQDNGEIKPIFTKKSDKYLYVKEPRYKEYFQME